MPCAAAATTSLAHQLLYPALSQPHASPPILSSVDAIALVHASLEIGPDDYTIFTNCGCATRPKRLVEPYPSQARQFRCGTLDLQSKPRRPRWNEEIAKDLLHTIAASTVRVVTVASSSACIALPLSRNEVLVFELFPRTEQPHRTAHNTHLWSSTSGATASPPSQPHHSHLILTGAAYACRPISAASA